MGVRNKVRLPSSVSDSHANDNLCRADSLVFCDAIPCPSKQVAITKVSAMNLRLGRAGSAWFERAVDILDTLGSSVMNLNNNSSFTMRVSLKESKISILAFEVGNTIIKGAKLMESFSEGNIKDLKTIRLRSEGVKMLVAEDMDELLRIAKVDMREELEKFSREVVRLGNHCKDPQWHNLDRYFKKLSTEHTKNMRLNADSTVQQLMTLVNHTTELFKALKVLDKVERDIVEKFKEDSTNVAQKGDIAILKEEQQAQRKHVIILKKKSLWSKSFEEVIKSLVDIVHFLHLKIHDAFGSADCYTSSEGSQSNNNRLGPAGIALNYAHIIRQIDTLVSLSSSMPTNLRDDLYHRLPDYMKSALSKRLRSVQAKDKEIPQVIAKMEKTLQWIVPIARNTTKFCRSDLYQKPAASHTDVLRIETLYHADKEKTEACIFELLVWLHHLISQARNDDVVSSSQPPECLSSKLTFEDQEMLDDVGKKISTPGFSKSQNFDASKSKAKLRKHHRLTKSSRDSPTSETNNRFAIRWPSYGPVIDFDIDRIKALDVIDGLGMA
ncbi:uncharacterized protein LOC21399486 isoform X2 [Morus notabilis]|uniref:uncharacterized protein LOC21399486 isoform X2 n=1 Tax=Morus notabilis TaxID=981085 RepID=UPI000CED6A04|nr:uncharacterized protein LOC21399486 isoform X2 [Morus notabilis]